MTTKARTQHSRFGFLVLLFLSAIPLAGLAACSASGADDDSTAEGAGEALSGRRGSTGASTATQAQTKAGVAAQACFDRCVAPDSEAKEIATHDLACFKPCEKMPRGQQAACIKACDKATAGACKVTPGSCGTIDRCSTRCFGSDGSLIADAGPSARRDAGGIGSSGSSGNAGGAIGDIDDVDVGGEDDDDDDLCDDGYYDAAFDAIASLASNDQGFLDTNDDGIDDDEWDDMVYRYGPSHMACWDFTD